MDTQGDKGGMRILQKCQPRACLQESVIAFSATAVRIELKQPHDSQQRQVLAFSELKKKKKSHHNPEENHILGVTLRNG